MFRKSRLSVINKSEPPRSERASTTSARSYSFETFEVRRLLAVTTFQQGVGGYAGGQDTVLYSITPNVNFGAGHGHQRRPARRRRRAAGPAAVRQHLRHRAGQIPLGSTINSATLTFSVFNDSNAAMQMSFYRMLVAWDQNTATWNSFGAIGGVQASEGEADGLPPDGILFDAATGTEDDRRHPVAAALGHGRSQFRLADRERRHQRLGLQHFRGGSGQPAVSDGQLHAAQRRRAISVS